MVGAPLRRFATLDRRTQSCGRGLGSAALAGLLLATACGGGDDVSASPGAGAAGASAAGGASGASSGGGSGGAMASGGAGGFNVGASPAGPAPTLKPELLLVTYVGGPGDQFVRGVEISDAGIITAKGKGFTVTYDAELSTGVVAGDASTVDADPYSEKPTLYKDWNTTWTVDKAAKRVDDPRNGLSYALGTQQVSSNLQQPIFLVCKTGDPCTKDAQRTLLWGWWASLAAAKSLGADARGYDVWLMPDGLVGVQLWTDGGNSTLGRDPRRTQPCANDACPSIDVTLAAGPSKDTWQPMPDGMSTMYMTIDPAKGEPVRATFLRGSHVTRITHDAWGRLLIPQAVGKTAPVVEPGNPFGHATSAASGLFVLDTDMKSLFDARIGGTCAGNGAQQVLPELALKGNLLVMAGTTCAPDLKVTDNAVQKSPGGGQDGFLVVLKLW